MGGDSGQYYHYSSDIFGLGDLTTKVLEYFAQVRLAVFSATAMQTVLSVSLAAVKEGIIEQFAELVQRHKKRADDAKSFTTVNN